MHSYIVQDVLFTIEDTHGLLSSTDSRILGAFASLEATCKFTTTMDMRVETKSMPALERERPPRVWSGEVDGHNIFIYRESTRRRVEVGDEGSVDFDTEQGWAIFQFPESSNPYARSYLLMQVIADSLCTGGHCFVHAACLASPGYDRPSGGILIVAPSHTGKTTTALALAKSGWRLLTDDMSYVRPARFGMGVWGFPRACHIRPGTLKVAPWLHELCLGTPDYENVRSLPIELLGSNGWVNAPWLLPELIVILEPHNTQRTVIEPIDCTQSLCLVSSESVNALAGVCDQDAPKEFQTLAELVQSAPSCRLSVGPDLNSVGDQLVEFINEHLPAFRQKRCLGRAA
jgi:hypothetical protein